MTYFLKNVKMDTMGKTASLNADFVQIQKPVIRTTVPVLLDVEITGKVTSVTVRINVICHLGDNTPAKGFHFSEKRFTN